MNGVRASWAPSTHHWKPSRPVLRIDVQLPCTVPAVLEDAQTTLGGHRRVEGEAAEDVQVVLALRRVAPQRAADEGVDAVGADEDVDLEGLAVRHPEPDAGLVLIEASTARFTCRTPGGRAASSRS